VLFNASAVAVHARRDQATVILCLGILLGVGCARQATEPAGSSDVTAEGVMQRMLDAYRQADSYQDRGVVRLQYQRAGQTYTDEAPMSVAWQSPNRLKVLAYQVELACDGDQLRARIRDEATRDFDGQVVAREAPSPLTLRDLWEEDEILSLAFGQGLAGYPPQLDLLMSPTPLAAVRDEGVRSALLEPAAVDGNPCHRIQVATSDGDFFLWVDQESYVLRRLEYPVAAFAPELADDNSVADPRLTVEFRGAAFGMSPASEQFAFSVSPAEKRVRRLIMPPRELPSDLFGQTTAPYEFVALDGEAVSSQSLGDRIKVLAWFGNHPGSRSTIQQLNRVFQQYKSQQRVAIHAICVEASSVTNEQIQSLARAWQVELPVARDLAAVGRDLFRIPWAPTLVVLDGNNVVQNYEVGVNPNLVAELPLVLEQLLAGQDVAGVILDQFRHERTRYEQALERGEPDRESAAEGVAVVASSSAPRSLQLRPLWKTDAVSAAGNILTVKDADATRFLVHAGYRTLVELDVEGNETARHTLDLPSEAAVSQSVTALAGSGTRHYATWFLRGPQVHVFDASWRRVLSYPPTSVEHEGVQDAILADLDGDGQLELYVGFWGSEGVHCVTLSGARLWRNQDLMHVLSLMSSPAEDGRDELWVASAAGSVARLDHHGRGEPFGHHTGQLVHHIFRGPTIDGIVAPYCGIAYGFEGRRTAIGLDRDGRSQWRYSLPSDSFNTQIRFVTPASLLDDDACDWLVAGADGSLHIISQDGTFTDHFHTGQAIAGLAGVRHAAAGLLVISGPDGLQAWQVSPPATARAE
jgi:hypothetical protein